MRRTKVLKGGETLFAECDVATNAWERMVGLLSRAGLREGEALYIAPCTSLHTFFMRFTMDAAFLNREGKVVAIYHSMRPWRLSGIHLRAAGVLEAPAGSLARAGVAKGDVLIVCPSS